MDSTRKKRIIAVLIISGIGICVFLSFRENTQNTSDLVVQTANESVYLEQTTSDQTFPESTGIIRDESPLVMVEEIPIYICGAVNLPGVYYVSMGTYLFELIDEAGGFSQDAAAEHINLVLVLNESLSIYIPSRSELENMSSSPHDPAGVIIRGSIDTYSWGQQSLQHVDQSPGSHNELININLASASELESLPGIGSATAQAIITYRETQGRFERIEDIMNVSGIKDSRFNSIRELICVD